MSFTKFVHETRARIRACEVDEASFILVQGYPLLGHPHFYNGHTRCRLYSRSLEAGWACQSQQLADLDETSCVVPHQVPLIENSPTADSRVS